MPDDEVTIEEWARDAAFAINTAIEECNALLQPGDKIKIFWGRGNTPGYESNTDCPDQFPAQVGLITWRDDDFSFTIWPREHRFLRTYCHRIRFVMDLPKPKVLSTDPSELCMMFDFCPFIGFVVKPVLAGPIPKAVGVIGVQTELPVDGINGRALLDTLSRLRVSFRLVKETLLEQQNVADFVPIDEAEDDSDDDA